jgi:hypothetical protein
MFRLIKRGITRDDVICALANGDLIEQYPDDYPSPSCLVLGVTVRGERLHVVCGLGEPDLWIITAYYPNPARWNADFKIRKEGTV